ncbi:MAG: hypothetical protein JO267_07045 [Alphaproteobacteria bacterium]|nr:hypothetical protein [Alphaproteobacteria bacterium]
MEQPQTAEAETPPQPAARPATENAARPPVCDTDAVVERWWSDHFPGSSVAQNTVTWNIAFAAKEDLKRRLQEGA